MRTITKIFTAGVLFIGLLITGFMFLLRGCLSKYDERYAYPPVLYFNNNGNETAVSLVNFSKTTSYTQHGGFTSKSFDHEYFIQSNDAITGEKVLTKPIEGHSIIKHFPVTVMGASNNKAWIFIDELMAFDAVTLEKVVDRKKIEEKNPVLKDQLPDESRYYQFNDEDKNIGFTARDGARWVLNTTTLSATPKEENKKTAAIHIALEWTRKLERLQEMNISFNEMIINQDTVNKQWMGLYSADEITVLNERVSLGPVYTQDSRRQLFTGTYNSPREHDFLIDKTGLINVNASAWFLDGGFLLNKQTAKPIWLSNPFGCLVVYKSEVGQEARLVLCRLCANGKVQWKYNTGLRNFIDWEYAGNKLFISGNDKSSDNNRCSLLLTVDLNSGTVNSYDYYSDQQNKK
jgi:hypothetical protein